MTILFNHMKFIKNYQKQINQRPYSHLIQRISEEKKILLQIEQLIKTIGRIQHIVLLYRNEFINHHQRHWGIGPTTDLTTRLQMDVQQQTENQEIRLILTKIDHCKVEVTIGKILTSFLELILMLLIYSKIFLSEQGPDQINFQYFKILQQ